MKRPMKEKQKVYNSPNEAGKFPGTGLPTPDESEMRLMWGYSLTEIEQYTQWVHDTVSRVQNGWIVSIPTNEEGKQKAVKLPVTKLFNHWLKHKDD